MKKIKFIIPDSIIEDCNSYISSPEFIAEIRELILEECGIQFDKIMSETNKTKQL